MLRDIFIDTNAAKNFANPLDPEYKRLIKWLVQNNRKRPSGNAYLVVSQKLLVEYGRSACSSIGATNICAVVDRLTRDGRLRKFTKKQIEAFKHKHFKKHVEKMLRCNMNDREHIPVVLLSDRKYAISLDRNLRQDLNTFPGFAATAVAQPQDLPYDQ